MIFEEKSYKDALRSSLLLRKQNFGKTFNFQNMANACRVQKTYLSRVFNGDAHLNDDQLYLACEYLGFNEDETNYVSLLHQFERSVVVKKKDRLKKQILRIRANKLATENHLRAKPTQAESELMARYYLDPNLQLVHMFLGIARYRKQPDLIRDQLKISEEDFQSTLSTLQQMDLVSLENGSYQVKNEHLHLSQQSPIFSAYRKLLRLKAMERIDQLTSSDSYTFSVFFTASEDTKTMLQKKMLALLEQAEQEVREISEPEHVYQMNFDLLRWSK